MEAGINFNMRCFEIKTALTVPAYLPRINFNMRCFEIMKHGGRATLPLR